MNLNETVRIFCSHDMGWPKRSSGLQYDSLSRVGHLIGLLTGKVSSYAIRSRKSKNDLNISTVTVG